MALQLCLVFEYEVSFLHEITIGSLIITLLSSENIKLSSVTIESDHSNKVVRIIPKI